ncbi:hypothetical protein F1737_08170 [Methanoplanus sp. FWC-SCC4]|uniref:Uncharacterized protein n=1 Tax=Methanochimaera problematica TaxID=2609417 RepID=A0AA97I4S3_9EURY|nr:hypothetical protein [Methanoplanus sp. FWC-SCC4]WOF16666.1 hypothetical protein F1737_08170 [Methanoplanus sp. FWC-SCC4]
MSLISDKVLKEVTFYLGPAAERFLERQTKYHMDGLAFKDIERKHLKDLAYWLKVSGGLIIDKGKAEEMARKVENLH